MTGRRPTVPYVRWERAVVRTLHAERDCCLAGSCATPYRPTWLAPVLVLGSFADHDDGRNARPGHAVVARVVGCQLRTVRRAVSWAVEHGWLAPVGRGMPGVAAVYSLAVPHPLAVVDGAR